MPFNFPPELIYSILEYLDKSSVLTCSLVCQAWLPPARYHSLHSANYVLNLNNPRIDSFLQLLESPHSSLHLLHIIELRLSQKGFKPVQDVVEGRFTGREWYQRSTINDFLCWKSSTGESLSMMFPSISSLFIQWADLSSLSESALASLYLDYTSITTLKLQHINIHSPTCLLNLICTFPSLRDLYILSEVQSNPFESIDDDALDSQQFHCPQLRSIRVMSATDENLTLLAALSKTSCPGILEIGFEQMYPSESCLGACNKLLQSSGECLKELKLRLPGVYPYEQHSLALSSLLKLTTNPNLQQISLDLLEDSFIIPFIQNLETDTTKIHTLQFSLSGITLDPSHLFSNQTFDWEMLDTLLSDSTRLPNLSCLGFCLRGLELQEHTEWRRREGEVMRQNAIATIERNMQEHFHMLRIARKATNGNNGEVSSSSVPKLRVTTVDLKQHPSREEKREQISNVWRMHVAEMKENRSRIIRRVKDMMPRVVGKVKVIDTTGPTLLQRYKID